MNSKNKNSWLIIIPSERNAIPWLCHPTLAFHGARIGGLASASSATDPQLIYDKNPLDIQSRDQVIREAGSDREAVLDHVSVNPLQ